MSQFVPSILAFVLSTVLLAAQIGCHPTQDNFAQEPWVKWARLPQSGNPVAIGASVASVASQDEIIRRIDDEVAGTLPGVRFYVVRYPAAIPGTNLLVHSWRDPQDGLVVFSWWIDANGAWTVGDLPWEVSHMRAGTDDSGRPWK